MSVITDDLMALMPEMEAWARKMTRDPDEAENLVQETLAKALEGQHSYHDSHEHGALARWCWVIMRNVWTDIRRQRVGRSKLADNNDLISRDDHPLQWSVERQIEEHTRKPKVVLMRDESLTQYMDQHMETVPSAEDQVVDVLDAADRHAALAVAMAQLPAHQLEVIKLHHIEGYSYEQVAAILDVPIGTVRSRIGRGMESLRDSMKNLGISGN